MTTPRPGTSAPTSLREAFGDRGGLLQSLFGFGETEENPSFSSIDQREFDNLLAAQPENVIAAIDQGFLTIDRDEFGEGPLQVRPGPLASLISPSVIANLLGFSTGGSGGLTAAQQAGLELDRASLFGFGGDGTPTLDREAFEQQRTLQNFGRLLDSAGLLGNLAGQPTLGGRAQSLDEELGRGSLALERELGLAGLGIDRDSLQRLIALDAQNEALQRDELGLRRGGLLGEIDGQQTLEAELGRAAQGLATEQFLTERRRNPSDFISAQLAFGGPGQTVGDVMIPGRVSEAIFGGDLPAASNQALTGAGRAGATSSPGSSLLGANLVTPSLQTLNQLNPEEIQAVAAAVPFLTQGQTTPTQFFSQAQQLGLAGFG